MGRSSLRLWLPYRVSPVHHRDHRTCRNRSQRPPLPRFLPLQRFPSHAEPLSPGGSHPSRFCCALRVSHPLDALLPAQPPGPVSSRSRSWGSPFEALIFTRRRTPSQTPVPSWGSCRAPQNATRPSRETARRPKPAGRPGYSPGCCPRCPLGFLPLQGLLPPAVTRHSRGASSPLALSQPIRMGSAAGAPGFLPQETLPLSLETDLTLLRFHTSSLFSALRSSRRAGS
jgi:hypothetical protein